MCRRFPFFGTGVEHGKFLFAADGEPRPAFSLISGRPASRSDFFWGERGDRLAGRLRGMNFQQQYALLCLEVWCRVFVDGAAPEDVPL